MFETLLAMWGQPRPGLVYLWMLSCLFIFVDAQTEVCSTGGPLGALNRNASVYLNIFVTLTFPCAGEIHLWQYYAVTTGVFYPTVWRPLSGESFQLVGWNRVEAKSTGLGIYYVPIGHQILVQEGDVLGIGYDLAGGDGGIRPIPYEDSRDPRTPGVDASRFPVYPFHNSNTRAENFTLGLVITGAVYTGIGRTPAIQGHVAQSGLCGQGGPMADLNLRPLERQLHVFTRMRLPCAGQLTGWAFYARHKGKFFASVWRPQPGNERLTLIGWNRLEADQLGVVTVSMPVNERILVEKNDVIGIFHESSTSPAVVAIETNAQSPSPCCKLSAADLSVTYIEALYFDQLSLDYVIVGPGGALRMAAIRAFVNQVSTNPDRVWRSGFEGETVSCPCSAGDRVDWSSEGKALITYDVTRDPQINTTDNRMSINTTSGALIISRLQLADNGATFVCHSDISGATFGKHFLPHQCNLEIEVLPEDMTLRGDTGPFQEGSQAVFICRVGRLRADLQNIDWLVAGKVVHTDTRQFFQITSNADGTLAVESQLSLTIHKEYDKKRLVCFIRKNDIFFVQGIIIQVGEDSQTFSRYLGESVALPCRPGSRQITTIVWYKGRDETDSARVATYTGRSAGRQPPRYFSPYQGGKASLDGNNGSLTIDSLMISDDSWFTCRVENHVAYRKVEVKVAPASVTVTLQEEKTSTSDIALSCNVSRVWPRVNTLTWMYGGKKIKSVFGLDLDSSGNADGTVDQLGVLFSPKDLSSIIPAGSEVNLTNILCIVSTSDLVIMQPYIPVKEVPLPPDRSATRGAVIALAVLFSLALIALLVIAILFFLHWRRKKREPQRMSMMSQPRSRMQSSADNEKSGEFSPRYSTDPTRRQANARTATPQLRASQTSHHLRPLPSPPEEDPTYLELQGSVDQPDPPDRNPLAGIHAMSTMDEYLDMEQLASQKEQEPKEEPLPSQEGGPLPKYVNYGQVEQNSQPTSGTGDQNNLQVNDDNMKTLGISMDTYYPMTGVVGIGGHVPVSGDQGHPLKVTAEVENPTTDVIANGPSQPGEGELKPTDSDEHLYDNRVGSIVPSSSVADNSAAVDSESDKSERDKAATTDLEPTHIVAQVEEPNPDTVELSDSDIMGGSLESSLPALNGEMSVHMPPLEDPDQSLVTEQKQQDAVDSVTEKPVKKSSRGSRMRRQQRLTVDDPEELDPGFPSNANNTAKLDAMDANMTSSGLPEMQEEDVLDLQKDGPIEVTHPKTDARKFADHSPSLEKTGIEPDYPDYKLEDNISATLGGDSLVDGSASHTDDTGDLPAQTDRDDKEIGSQNLGSVESPNMSEMPNAASDISHYVANAHEVDEQVKPDDNIMESVDSNQNIPDQRSRNFDDRESHA